MSPRVNKNRTARRILLCLAGVGAVALIYVGVVARLAKGGLALPERAAAQEPASHTRLVANMPDTLQLEPATAKSLGVQTVEARSSTQPRQLELQGSLALDTNQLVRIHSRFAGEVIEVCEIPDDGAPPRDGKPVLRPVGFGDRVAKGQLLAVVWCKDLGEKKSELADALSQLHFDQEQLQKMTEGASEGAVSEARLRLQERNVEADLTAVARAERTLRVWRLPEDEIEAVKQEAVRIRERKGRRDPEKEKAWARVEVVSPIDGVVVEKNTAKADIVDTTADLFKVANVDSLTVWANAYEENLPALLDLAPAQKQWSVRLNADPTLLPLAGRIEKIGYVSDPAQHTVMVMGRVNNPGGRLRAGQFITATVELPPLPHEVVVPAAALVEDGHESAIFVQSKANEPCYSLRHVAVAWRGPEEVHLRTLLKPDEVAAGVAAIKPGERVVATAAIQLRGALDDLTSAGKAAD